MALVKSEELAKVCNLTERRVQQLVKEGMPRETRGRYDLAKCMMWYIRYLQKKLEAKAIPDADGGSSTLNEHRSRLMRADAELKEIELAQKRGQLVAIADIERETTNLVLDVKARVLAVPARLAADLVGQQDSRVMIQAKIDKALKDALTQLAKVERK